MEPSLAGLGAYDVALIGDTAGEDTQMWRGDFRLTRLIEWAGLERRNFDIYNTINCNPRIKLEGLPIVLPATQHCRRSHWGDLLKRPKVLVPMGPMATSGILGRSVGLLDIRGYIEGTPTHYVIPTVHPSYIERGQSNWSAAFINDIQKAVLLSRSGMPPQVTDYRLDPSPMAAYNWAQDYTRFLSLHPTTRLAFDIETPGKGDEDELDTDGDAPDRTWLVERIGFSYAPLSGLSIPWAPEYMAAIRLILGSDGEKVVWNAGFDVPRVRRMGVGIHGIIHDAMVAWHILHSDLPKSLRFVATFTCPWQPAWKHLSGAKPAFYNCTDADVEWRSMDVIGRELAGAGLWDVYQRDVLDLEPILVHMHERGMPVDAEIRLDRAIKLATRIATVKQEMESAVPLEARRIAHVYAKTPADIGGLLQRPSHRLVPCCARCGSEKPGKLHFKAYKKKVNPCANELVVLREQPVTEFYRLADFTPSREQLSRYHQHLGRALPMVFDKATRSRKVSFGERQLRDLAGLYPNDVVYSSILEFRSLDKLAGTYIGRVIAG